LRRLIPARSRAGSSSPLGALQFAERAFNALDFALLGCEILRAGEGWQFVHHLDQGRAERQQCAHCVIGSILLGAGSQDPDIKT
jgi:hypothetical protein